MIHCVVEEKEKGRRESEMHFHSQTPKAGFETQMFYGRQTLDQDETPSFSPSFFLDTL